jgi:putative PIN family toxin of toxin-antitoxin system
VTRVVIDANVYISALVFGGVPQKVIDLIETQGASLFVSPPIMDEVTEVLIRKFDWTRAEVEQFLPPLWRRCVVIRPLERIEISKDPDDNRVLECAEAAKADLLVTGNARHFPEFHKTTKIISPRQFLDLLRGGKQF